MTGLNAKYGVLDISLFKGGVTAFNCKNLEAAITNLCEMCPKMKTAIWVEVGPTGAYQEYQREIIVSEVSATDAEGEMVQFTTEGNIRDVSGLLKFAKSANVVSDTFGPVCANGIHGRYHIIDVFEKTDFIPEVNVTDSHMVIVVERIRGNRK